MKGFLLALAGAVMLAGAAFSAPAAESGPPISGQMQNFEPLDEPAAVPGTGVRTRDGGTVTLDDLRGRLLIVNFWATWCGPCVRELPSLQALAGALPSDRVAVVLVSQDRGGFAQTDPFLARHELTFEHTFIDEKLSLSRALGVRSLPTTVLVAPDGRELGRLTGAAEWNTPEARALVDYYLEETAASR